jgi:hypothetical protein
MVQLQLSRFSSGIDCIVQQIDHANYIFAYNLMMYVEVPESSGLDLAHLFSPIVTIAHYGGDSADADAPSWTCIPPHKIFDFHQPRHVAVELFFKLALSKDNSAPSVGILLFVKLVLWLHDKLHRIILDRTC